MNLLLQAAVPVVFIILWGMIFRVFAREARTYGKRPGDVRYEALWMMGLMTMASALCMVVVLAPTLQHHVPGTPGRLLGRLPDLMDMTRPYFGTNVTVWLLCWWALALVFPALAAGSMLHGNSMPLGRNPLTSLLAVVLNVVGLGVLIWCTFRFLALSPVLLF